MASVRRARMRHKFGHPPKTSPQPSSAPDMSDRADSLKLNHLSVIYNPTL